MAEIIQDLTLLLLVSLPINLLFHKIKWPSVMGYLLAGVLIGPHAMGWIADPKSVEDLAEIGIILLLFLIGLEFSLSHLLENVIRVVGAGFLQLTLIAGSVYLLAPSIGIPAQSGVLLGILIGLSSTAIILKVITDTISEPRKEMSKYAPVLEQLTISVDKIGTLIGPGGKTINGLVEEYGLEGIDVTDEGIVTISAATGEHLADALKKITALTHEYEVGEIVEGEVVKLLEFGAIVDFGGRDGMIHVSEMSQEFVEKASDIVELGQIVKAKIVRVDNGKIGLSLKRLQDNG